VKGRKKAEGEREKEKERERERERGDKSLLSSLHAAAADVATLSGCALPPNDDGFIMPMTSLSLSSLVPVLSQREIPFPLTPFTYAGNDDDAS
jgi:hypothetical protein